MNAEIRAKLRIGIDFGTAFSAVAFTYHDWTPGQGQDGTPEPCSSSSLNIVRFGVADQVKTQVAWHDGAQDYIWGTEVDRAIRSEEILEMDRINMLKLGLNKTQATQKIRDHQTRQLQRIPSKPNIEDIITIYLNRLFRHAKTSILNKLGTGDAVNIFDHGSVECAIGVPAVWDTRALRMMICAAERAGIPNPDLVQEPEAAAALIMQDQQERPQVVIARADGQTESLLANLNEAFLVADVGGGTADFITYIVESRTPTLKMREGMRGQGGLHGSALLDRAFASYFTRYAAKRMESFLQELGKPCSLKSRKEFVDAAVRDFEVEKCDFDGSSANHKMNIRVAGIRAARIMIPNEDIEKVFSKILDPIVDIIERQVNSFNDKYDGQGRRIKNIAFVGGLSANPHALKVLKRTFSERRSPLMGYPISVITPHENSATVVARGAVLRAVHRDAIGERYLRRSFGVAWDEPYERGTHESWRKTRDGHDNIEVVEDSIRWLFRVDEAVRRGEVRSLRGWRCAPLKGPILIRENLYGSYSETNNHLWVHDCKNDIELIGALEVDLSDKIDRDSFPKLQNEETGKTFLTMDYEVRVAFDHPQLKCEIIIPRHGKFPSTGKDWGPDPFRVPLAINCAAVLEIIGHRTDQLHQARTYSPKSPTPYGSSIPTRKRMASSSPTRSRSSAALPHQKSRGGATAM